MTAVLLDAPRVGLLLVLARFWRAAPPRNDGGPNEVRQAQDDNRLVRASRTYAFGGLRNLVKVVTMK